MGGAAVLMTNRRDLIHRCRYKLEATVRVITAAEDGAFHAVEWSPDEVGRHKTNTGK